MANLTKDQIRKYASDAGFSGNDLDIAVAVALAESGGNPSSHNTNAGTGDNSYGLWQINMLGSLGPDRRAKFKLKSNNDLFDPATNARVAHGIWASNGWKAWTTYTSGKYKKYYESSAALSQVQKEVSGLAGDLQASDNAGPNPILGVGDAINAFGQTIFKGFQNIGGILVAIALVVLGVVILLRDFTPVGKATKVLTNVAGKVGE